MPELPEVETVRRGMVDAMCGKSIEQVTVRRYDLRGGIPEDLADVMTGKEIRLLERRGKYILIHFGDHKTAVLHLGMSGRIRIYSDKGAVENKKHDHVILIMSDGCVVIFEDPRRFGMLYLVRAPHWQEEKPFSEMGAEPLSNEWSGQDLAFKLSNRKSPIKNALLDQSVVAGLGNIYVCEALFFSGISPSRLAYTLKSEEIERLVVHVRTVLNNAIAAGGSSLKDYAQTDGSLGYFQFGFKVYDREGHICPNECGGNVHRIVQGGRSTFYCPNCQV